LLSTVAAGRQRLLGDWVARRMPISPTVLTLRFDDPQPYPLPRLPQLLYSKILLRGR